jgi:hypothetical protein
MITINFHNHAQATLVGFCFLAWTLWCTFAGMTADSSDGHPVFLGVAAVASLAALLFTVVNLCTLVGNNL